MIFIGIVLLSCNFKLIFLRWRVFFASDFSFEKHRLTLMIRPCRYILFEIESLGDSRFENWDNKMDSIRTRFAYFHLHFLTLRRRLQSDYFSCLIFHLSALLCLNYVIVSDDFLRYKLWRFSVAHRVSTSFGTMQLYFIGKRTWFPCNEKENEKNWKQKYYSEEWK